MTKHMVALGITLAIVGVDCAAAEEFRIERKTSSMETEEALKRYRDSLLREEEQFLSAFHIRKSKELLTARNIEEARKHAEEAVRLDGGNLEARTLLRQIGDLAPRKSNRYNPCEELRGCYTQPVNVEIRNHIGKADALFAARKFGDALREYEGAITKLDALPFSSELKECLPDVKMKIEAVREAKRLHESAAEAAQREDYVRQEVRLFVRDKLNIAYIYFSRRRFDRAAKACDEILAIDPRYRRARELREDVLKSKHKDEWYNVTAAKIVAWQNMTESRDETIPYSESFRYPSAEEWREISRRAPICFFVEETPAAEKPSPPADAVRIVIKE